MDTRILFKTKESIVDDSELILLASKNADAFAELYHRHVTRVYRYHMAHVGNIKDAEDLTSQTFMAALEGLKNFRGEGTFAAWILGIASRKKLMFFRARKPEVQLEAADQIPSPNLATDKLAGQRLRMESIARALKQIASDRADAIILVYFGGLSNEEAARALGKTEAAVKMLISRGLSDLRERTTLKLEVEE